MAEYGLPGVGQRGMELMAIVGGDVCMQERVARIHGHSGYRKSVLKIEA